MEIITLPLSAIRLIRTKRKEKNNKEGSEKNEQIKK
jgi:hypothetical protein